jgi:NAD(P)H-dependent flavin oxidoreductase YrpB (nitropropane dioxygenase family)
MGVGVSSWQLARAVAEAGQLGVVSGTAVAVTLARRLWAGDRDGHLRGALAHFPDQSIADRIVGRYHRDPPDAPTTFPSIPMGTLRPPRSLVELTVAAAFVEVWLARHGQAGEVGMNLLEKVQLPTLPTLYGALLAGVDYVFMGAGIPTRIPGVLDRLANNEPARLPIAIGGHAGEPIHQEFDPRSVLADPPPLSRPFFAAIVSSTTLARHLEASSHGPPDGFVVEHPRAGGHNAPPRGRLKLDGHGEPIYGPRDTIDLDTMAALGRPFWVAGGQATPDALADARRHGAAGIQVGTAFAFCDESGIDPALRTQVLAAATAGQTRVFTDPQASPTGFPFKTLMHPGTIADPAVYRERPRRCDLGYLRQAYLRPDGLVGYRCPAEPVDDFVRKGGQAEETVGRQCLCNGLVATIGLGQARPNGYHEPPLLTTGDDITNIHRYLIQGRDGYRARDVIDHLLGPTAPAHPAETPAVTRVHNPH